MANVYCVIGNLLFDDGGPYEPYRWDESFLFGVFEHKDSAIQACKAFDFEKFYFKRAEEISVVEREELGLLDLESKWLDNGELHFTAYDEEERMNVDLCVKVVEAPLDKFSYCRRF